MQLAWAARRLGLSHAAWKEAHHFCDLTSKKVGIWADSLGYWMDSIS